MAIKLNMYSLPGDKFVAICEYVYSIDIDFDKWMKREYDAVCTSDKESSWVYRFNDQARYTEFCLRWL